MLKFRRHLSTSAPTCDHERWLASHANCPTAKSQNHIAASLPHLVENLVKNWEVEASFKPNLEDWRTIDHANYVSFLLMPPSDHMPVLYEQELTHRSSRASPSMEALLRQLSICSRSALTTQLLLQTVHSSILILLDLTCLN